MPKTQLLSLFLLFGLGTAAQVNENFSDGDYTTNPAWTASSSDWIINSSYQLQSNNTVANSSFYISTPNTLATRAQWEFYLRLNFNTSSANYVDVYLTASASDLSAGTTAGYFVRIGNTQDDICLYRKDADGTMTKIIDGTDGVTNSSDNTLKIKVTRDASDQFTLYSDNTGTGNNYTTEGTIIDNKYTTSAFFGILIKQSTSSFFQRHYFDDIVVQNYTPDLTPPSIQSVTANSTTSVDVLFSEPVDAITSQQLSNYLVDNSIGNPNQVQRDATNTALVHLHFAHALTLGQSYNITINGVKDLAGNAIINGSSNFSYYIAQQFDVVIDEIMADPSPPLSLPNAEFVELKNISGRTIDLGGFVLTSSTSSSGAFPSYSLPADSFLIITSTSDAASFAAYGRVLGVSSFPALINGGTTITLLSKEGNTIHAVNYSTEWYQNAVKAEGGWTLEMIDTREPCAGMNNWKASEDASGGTPGRKNSVDGVNSDDTPPQLFRTYCTDSVTVVAVFDEPMDSLSASVITNYSLSSGVSIQAVHPIPPFFDSVILKLSSPLEKSVVSYLTVNNIKDCKGNSIGIYNNAKLGWGEEALPNDLVINEILYNPRPNAFDYVELYNKSDKIIDASKLFIANRSATGAISSVKRLSELPYNLFPGDYLVVTENAGSLKQEYLVKDPSAILTLSSLPSFPDDKGDVVITNIHGIVVDEVSYSDKWQFPLISNTEGVALERIDPAGPSQDQNNWHSAATTAGYGTPTYKNSQYRLVDDIKATIDINPKVFSPDNDGHDDVATISYQVEESGYIANITIFDANGRLVRYLVKNNLLGLKGSWTWDGVGENGQKLPRGSYVVYTELFNLQGKRKQFKNVLVLASR